jgi:FKBP-type peptidyl-prolyl cis-trans isomerase FkpA
MKIRFVFLLLLIGPVAGCNHDVLGAGTPSDPPTETFAASLAVDIPSFSRKESGVYFRDLRIGTGEEAAEADQVTMTYAGYLKNGTLFTTQSTPLQQPLAVFVPGFRDGVAGMKVGGIRKIVIPSELAYSWEGRPNANPPIPRNATLIFDVELFGVTKPATTQ